MQETILFKYASKSRPENFFRGLNSIIDNLNDKESYHVLCSFDVDDKAYANSEFIERLKQYKNVSHYFGISYKKVSAINRDLEFAPHFSILCNFSDDMCFTQQGFDDIMRNDFREAGSLDWFIHYPDGKVQERLSTMSVMGRDYFLRFNYIYHPDFKEIYCDDYAMAQAKHLGKHKYIDKALFQHLHPAWGLAPTDDLYKRWENPEAYAIDKAVYDRLKAELI